MRIADLIPVLHLSTRASTGTRSSAEMAKQERSFGDASSLFNGCTVWDLLIRLAGPQKWGLSTRASISVPELLRAYIFSPK